jgi:hypothetical protein
MVQCLVIHADSAIADPAVDLGWNHYRRAIRIAVAAFASVCKIYAYRENQALAKALSDLTFLAMGAPLR